MPAAVCLTILGQDLDQLTVGGPRNGSCPCRPQYVYVKCPVGPRRPAPSAKAGKTLPVVEQRLQIRQLEPHAIGCLRFLHPALDGLCDTVATVSCPYYRFPTGDGREFMAARTNWRVAQGNLSVEFAIQPDIKRRRRSFFGKVRHLHLAWIHFDRAVGR
jgi:hypothetical protein